MKNRLKSKCKTEIQIGFGGLITVFHNVWVEGIVLMCLCGAGKKKEGLKGFVGDMLLLKYISELWQ